MLRPFDICSVERALVIFDVAGQFIDARQREIHFTGGIVFVGHVLNELFSIMTRIENYDEIDDCTKTHVCIRAKTPIDIP